MQEPPVVKLHDHPAKAGYILAWRQRPDRSWEALVEFVIDVPGYRGGLEPQKDWAALRPRRAGQGRGLQQGAPY